VHFSETPTVPVDGTQEIVVEMVVWMFSVVRVLALEA
jgi:hypothetical protein